MAHYKQEQISLKDYILLTPAVDSPVSLESVKLHLRIDGDDFDSQLFSFINVATEYGESITGRDFINKTYKGFLKSFPDCSTHGIEIKKSKLQSITSIQYYSNGTLETLSSSDYYFTETTGYSKIYLNEGKSWPTVDDRQQSIVITFVAGYGDDSCDVPAALKQAILTHIAYLFENAGDCADNGESLFKSLYLPYILAQKMVLVI